MSRPAIVVALLLGLVLGAGGVLAWGAWLVGLEE
jgi:hypothetical protein